VVLDILSLKNKLEAPVYIKPDLTPHERQKERLLLKERRSLFDNGTERRNIKIRNDSLYVNNKFHCKVSGNNLEFASNPVQPAVDAPTTIMESSWLPASKNPNTVTLSDLKLSIANFCSIVNKQIQLEAFLVHDDIDIIIGTESHLNETIQNSEIFSILIGKTGTTMVVVYLFQ